MKLKIKLLLKKLLVLVMCLASLANTIDSAIPIAEARGSEEILGTNTALGSPLLNENNFSTEDWNKWETICWGVFLSNFCQPLIDTYETAFVEGKGDGTNSNGAGFNALWGGSGSDKANAKIIKALTDYAIESQTAYSDKIYVGFTAIEEGNPNTKVDVNAANANIKILEDPSDYPSQTIDNLRPAKFQDLWLIGACNSGCTSYCTSHSWAQYKHVDKLFSKITLETEWSVWSEEIDPNNILYKSYDDIGCISCGNIPTFYIKRGDKFVEIWDYTDWWDIQVIASMTNSIRNADLGKTFDSKFSTYWDENPDLKLDPYGNIVLSSNVMAIPAAVNQHITGEKSINTLNSWMMNSYVNTVSTDSAVLGLKQTINTVNWQWNVSEITNGYPAFGKSNVGNIGLFYYDLDVIYTDSIRNKKNIKYGDAILELFSLELDNDKTSTIYPIKYEVAGNGVGGIKWWNDGINTDRKDNIIANTYIAASMLPNVNFEKGENQKTVLSQIIKPDGQKIDLFSTEPIAIAVKAKASSVKTENKTKGGTNEGFIRRFYNYLYQCYAGNITGYKNYDTNDIISLFQGKSWEDLGASLGDGGQLRKMMYNFTQYMPKYKNKQDLADSWNTSWDYGENETGNYNTNRIVLAYPPSKVMVEVAKILGIKDGAEFDTYCTYIYMTYLDFYGVSATSTLTETSYSSKFNSMIYMSDEEGKVDENGNPTGRADSILIEDIGASLNKHGGTFEHTVDIEEEVLQYSYLMLSPSEGRDYRKTMIEDGMSDWIYEQYNKIVYGGSGKYAGSASKYRSGFLAIENYSDNFLTSWFLEYYVEVAVWAIMLAILFIIIIGIIKGKKISWFFISAILIINSILLVPSGSEIVPYATSKITQKMFTNKMTFWSISQGITNASIERDLFSANSVYNKLDKEDASAIADLVKSLSVLQTDSSLCVKQDISQKVTQRLAEGVYSDIESYQSARWILPMVMQQFTSDDMSAEYVYKPLANIWDDMSNMYWYFNPENAEHIQEQSPTLTSHQNSSDIPSADITNNGYELYDSLYKYFGDVNKEKSQSKLHYFKNSDIDYRSSSYRNDNRTLAHLVCYYLDSNIDNAVVAPPVKRQDMTKKRYRNLDSDEHGGLSTWREFIDTSKVSGALPDNWSTDTIGGFADTADSYERDNRETVTSDMPYLLSTESPIYYFYSVVKDSFDDSISLGGLIFELQGETTRTEDGEVIRKNFMYATKDNVEDGSVKRVEATPYVKDILDLEEMFYNMIPYMYQMQLVAGGFDGKSGILVGEDKVTPLKIGDELNYYEGELQSWMYRCNWATKIMENPNFEKSAKIRDANGKEYIVDNMLLWERYPEERPMVFSEAQKHAMGLEDRDLNIVELKCIEVNKKVAKQWTLLVNYAGTKGITTEVLMRQMATDATLIFCQEFSSSGLLDTTYEIYPQSLDLRYISFDSIMKMIVMNVSKDTSYIYGDTMLTVISNSDIITSILLLLAALLCALLVPLARCVLLAMVFYLGFIGIFKLLLNDNKTKANVACGQLISNLIFMIYTLVYFFCFYLMMNLTSSDEVLTVSNIKAEAGNPVWAILIVILLGVLYIFVMVKHIIFCWTNRADMGFAAYSRIAGNIVEAVHSTADSAREKISGFFSSDESNTINGTSNTNSISGTGITDSNTQSSNTQQSSINNTIMDEEQLNSNSTIMDSESSNEFNTIDTENILSNTSSDDIDAEIETGKLMEEEDISVEEDES